MSEQLTEKNLRTRKFRLFLPVIIVPIITIFFWLMGGGTKAVSSLTKRTGLNTQLPGAIGPKDSAKDKMAFYLAADADSSKRVEQMRMDPYRQDTVGSHVPFTTDNYVRNYSRPIQASHETDLLAEKIATIRQQVASSQVYEPVSATTKQPVARNSEPDPEMEAINGTLDKILAIQHPQKEISTGRTANSSAYAVNTGQGTDTTYFGKRNGAKKQDSFYTDATGIAPNSGAIPAIIPTEQTLQNGSVVKLELWIAVTINGLVLPAGTNVFGIASLEGERLLVRVPSIRFQNNLLPVSLTVYDLDGLEGIYTPGSIARDVAKASADNAIQSAGISGFDLSIKTQAAAAGIGAAKNLLSKKVKQVRVTLTAGYQVLLHDSKQSTQ